MARLGIPWDRHIVANLENGRRQAVSVTELLGLAYVLDVSPLHLLVPPLDSTEDEGPYLMVVPSRGFPLHVAREWVRGNEPAPGQDPRIFLTEVPLAEVDQGRVGGGDTVAESARIRYHRDHGHQLRAGAVSSKDYWAGAAAAVEAARRGDRSGDDGER